MIKALAALQRVKMQSALHGIRCRMGRNPMLGVRSRRLVDRVSVETVEIVEAMTGATR
jgi:hypothetical protein